MADRWSDHLRLIFKTIFSLLVVAMAVTILEARAGQAIATPILPDKPSIVVLPFTSHGENAVDAYLIDGLTDSLIAGLSSVAGILSIARHSSFHYQDKRNKAFEIARELGVRWLLAGTVSKAGKLLHIRVRMVEGQSGEVRWTQVYKHTRKTVRLMLVQLQKDLLKILQVQLTEKETENFRRPETESPQAHDAFLKGLYHYRRRTPEHLALAVPALKQAVKMDPKYARAHAILAAVYIQAWRAGWHTALGFAYGERSRPRELAEDHIEAAMHRPTALALRWKARLVTFNKRAFDQAVAIARSAIAIEPGSPQGYVGMNYVLGYMHELDEAEQAIKSAIRLDPHHPTYRARLAWIDYYRGDFEAAISRLRAAIAREPNSYLYYVNLISALGHLGRVDEATLAIAEMQATRARLGMTPVLLYYLRYWPYKYDADRALMRAGLEKAGLRD